MPATNFQIKQMSVQLLVSDLNRSIEFYTKQLLFDIEFRYEDFYCGIIKDNFSIHLKEGKVLPEERKIKKQNEDVDIFFTMNHIEELFNNFSNKEIKIIQPLRAQSYGKEFYIEDIDGYILAFVEME